MVGPTFQVVLRKAATTVVGADANTFQVLPRVAVARALTIQRLPEYAIDESSVGIDVGVGSPTRCRSP